MKTLEIRQMESLQGGSWWRCALGVVGSALLGSAGGIAGAIGGAMVGAATFCGY
jgi:hypothetical protein